MSDEIMTRNSAGELELRTVQTTGDTGNDKNDVLTRDSQGRLCVRTTGSGGGSGGKNYDAEIEALDNAVSVLSTSVDLSTEIGGKTTVALADLSAMDIDGRPSYKQAGATVYADNGAVGIIDSVNSVSAIVTTVSVMRVPKDEYEWLKAKVEGVAAQTRCLYLNFGALEDGTYEFFVKNPLVVATSAFGCRFVIRDGNPPQPWSQESYYYPLPQMSSGAFISGWASQQFSSMPLLFGKSGDDFVFLSQAGYPNIVAGAVDEGADGRFFEFTKLINVETGNVLELKEYSVYSGDNFPVDMSNISQSFTGKSPYRTEIQMEDYSTSRWWEYFSNNDESLVQAIWIDYINPNAYVMADTYLAGQPYIGKDRLCLISTLTQDICELEFGMGVGKCWGKVIRATGVFADLDWKIAFLDGNTEGASGQMVIPFFIYADGFHFNDVIVNRAFFGSNGNGTSAFFNFFNDVALPEEYKSVAFTKEKIQTASSANYVIQHENGLIEMGGVVPVADTLQPNVALGNIPVVFTNELANANFVPTITVMTDGTFKQVMADVANPTTTGFDLCVRNVDTDAVSNIKIAWKIVGTRK